MDIPKEVNKKAKKIAKGAKNISKEKRKELEDFTRIELCPKCEAPMSRDSKGFFCGWCNHKEY
jgi:mRNA-degrading endonuclease RelE of RelBE toxin-antitoxin system